VELSEWHNLKREICDRVEPGRSFWKDKDELGCCGAGDVC
jgi:hypothetical protein